MAQCKWNLRELYRNSEDVGVLALEDAQQKLDASVRKAYGMKADANVLEFLFKLNQEVADYEETMKAVTGPGLPPCVKDPSEFITDDCVTMPGDTP